VKGFIIYLNLLRMAHARRVSRLSEHPIFACSLTNLAFDFCWFMVPPGAECSTFWPYRGLNRYMNT
jgi:hypothetical protein